MSVCEGKDDRKRTIHRGSRYEVIVEGYVGDTRDVLLRSCTTAVGIFDFTRMILVSPTVHNNLFAVFYGKADLSW